MIYLMMDSTAQSDYSASDGGAIPSTKTMTLCPNWIRVKKKEKNSIPLGRKIGKIKLIIRAERVQSCWEAKENRFSSFLSFLVDPRQWCLFIFFKVEFVGFTVRFGWIRLKEKRGKVLKTMADGERKPLARSDGWWRRPSRKRAQPKAGRWDASVTNHQITRQIPLSLSAGE